MLEFGLLFDVLIEAEPENTGNHKEHTHMNVCKWKNEVPGHHQNPISKLWIIIYVIQ